MKIELISKPYFLGEYRFFFRAGQNYFNVYCDSYAIKEYAFEKRLLLYVNNILIFNIRLDSLTYNKGLLEDCIDDISE